jgi:uncharacterized protein YidB (DUF937 family)
MMLQQNGGLEGILGRFRQSGLSEQADSWVGTGQNMNLSPDQLQQTFGPAAIQDPAAQLGHVTGRCEFGDSPAASGSDQPFYPEGRVPENNNEGIAQSLSMLANSDLSEV